MKKFILIFIMLITSFSVGLFPADASPVNPNKPDDLPGSVNEPLNSIADPSTLTTPSKAGYIALSKRIVFPSELTKQQKFDWVNEYPALFNKLPPADKDEYKQLYPSEYYNKIYVTGVDESIDVDTKDATKFSSDLISSSKMLWLMVPKAIISNQNPMYSGHFDIMSVANMPGMQAIFKTFAYSLCLLFIGINLLSTTLKYELFTTKGGVKIAGQILLAKIWVDLSYMVCKTILDINNGLVGRIVIQGITMNFFNNDLIPKVSKSKVPIIGPIIDFFKAFSNSIPMTIMGTLMTIAGAIVIIKLMLRSIELAAMVAMAPPFFACLAGGESTTRYFRNFITAFISLAVETIYIAIVYCVGSLWFTDVAIDPDNSFIALIPNCIAMIGIAILVAKPPRVFKNLIS